MDLFIVKERLKMMLWLVGAAFFIGIFATWHARGQIGVGGVGREQFLLCATVTGALAVAWAGVLIVYGSTHRTMARQLQRIRPSRSENVPWWVVKCLVLCVFIVAMALVLLKHGGWADNEFGLLQKGKLTRLEERLLRRPELMGNQGKKTGKTLLEMALESGNAAAVDMLLTSGAELEDVADRLNLVAALKNPPMLEALLRHGIDPDEPDTAGFTLLYHAVGAGNTNGINVLVDAGANLNARDPVHQTPLIMAVMADDLPMAKCLVGQGADPNLLDQRGETALHKAVRRRNLEASDFLLENGADPGIFNHDGMSPLHIAAHNGQDELVEFFLEQSNLVDQHTESGLTSFEQALRSGHYDTARLLLRHGADINHIGANGSSILYRLLIAREYNRAEFLIAEGGDVNIANTKDETPANLMHRKGLESLLNLVEQRDSPPATNATDSVESP